MNFEESFKQLETLLQKMNSGELSLDESLSHYEKADTLIQNCQTQLKKAEQKIEKLIQKRDSDHQEEAKPSLDAFEPSSQA